MSIRVFGNQHGHFVQADGRHLAFLKAVAARGGVTLEEALERVLAEYLRAESSQQARGGSRT